MTDSHEDKVPNKAHHCVGHVSCTTGGVARELSELNCAESLRLSINMSSFAPASKRRKVKEFKVGEEFFPGECFEDLAVSCMFTTRVLCRYWKDPVSSGCSGG